MATTRLLTLGDFQNELNTLKQNHPGFYSNQPTPSDQAQMGDALTAMLLTGFRNADFGSQQQTQLYVNASENLERLIWLDVASSNDPSQQIKNWIGVLQHEVQRNNFALAAILQSTLQADILDPYLKQLPKEDQNIITKLTNQNTILALVKNNANVLPSYNFILNGLDRAGKGNLANFKAIRNDLTEFANQFASLQTSIRTEAVSKEERQLLNGMKATMGQLAGNANNKDSVAKKDDVAALKRINDKEIAELNADDFNLMRRYSDSYSTVLDESIRLTQADLKKTQDQYQTVIQKFATGHDSPDAKDAYRRLSNASSPFVKAQYVAEHTSDALLVLANQFREYAFKYRDARGNSIGGQRKETALDMATALYDLVNTLQPKTLQEMIERNNPQEFIDLNNRVQDLNNKVNELMKEQTHLNPIKNLANKMGRGDKTTLTEFLEETKKELKTFNRVLPAVNPSSLTQTTANPQVKEKKSATENVKSEVNPTPSVKTNEAKSSETIQKSDPSTERITSASEKRMMQRYAQRQKAFAALKGTNQSDNQTVNKEEEHRFKPR